MNKRFVVISDVHSNLEALRAVLDDVRRAGIEEMYCLGDVVGYGPDPEETVKLIRSVAGERTLLGNHDYATLHPDSEYVYGFNPVAVAAVLYQRANLSEEALAWLESLPRTIRTGDLLFCHGSPRDTDHYLIHDNDYQIALDSREADGARLIFFGHTHVPVVARDCGGADIEYDYLEAMDAEDSVEIPLDPACVYLINPGSVGQPRDGRPDASYAIVDPARSLITFRRVRYDVAAVQRKILAAGLPSRLAERLSLGQ